MAPSSTVTNRPTPTAEEIAALVDAAPPDESIGHDGVWYNRASARVPFSLVRDLQAHLPINHPLTNKMTFFIEEIFELAYIHMARNIQLRKVSPKAPIAEPLLVETELLADLMKIIQRLAMLSAIHTKQLTRRNVAELLKVHENTVARWVKENQAIEKVVFELQYILFEQMAILHGTTPEVIRALTPHQRLEIIKKFRSEYTQYHS